MKYCESAFGDPLELSRAGDPLELSRATHIFDADVIEALVTRCESAFGDPVELRMANHIFDADVIEALVTRWSMLAALRLATFAWFGEEPVQFELCPEMSPVRRELLQRDMPLGMAICHHRAYRARVASRDLRKGKEPWPDAPMSNAGWAAVHYAAAEGNSEAVRQIMNGPRSRECLHAVCPVGTAAFVAAGCAFWTEGEAKVAEQNGLQVVQILCQAAARLGCLASWINMPVPVLLLGQTVTVLTFSLQRLSIPTIVSALLDAGATVKDSVDPCTFVRALSITRGFLRPLSCRVKTALAGLRPSGACPCFLLTPPGKLLPHLPPELVNEVVEYMVGKTPWVREDAAHRWEERVAVRRSME